MALTHTFDWSAGYASQRSPLFARNVVSTSHPLAAQAGLRMLQAGGNAVDAIVATAAVLTIVEPCSNGLGSDAFCILWDGTQLHGLNASGPAPAAWTPAYFRARYGADAKRPPKRGWDSVTVPGAVAAWTALHRRFGKLPFGDLLAPAIEVAERGYAVPVVIQQKWRNAASLPELTAQPGFAEAFMQGPGWSGREPQVGERFTFAAAARSLRLIAQTQGEAFYRGEIAAAAEAHARAHGGAMTAADFAAYQPEWVEPIGRDYRGYRLHEIPPNGQGIAALIALGILEKFDLAALPVDGVASQHLQIEAMKLAFADVYKYVAEPRSMRRRSEVHHDHLGLREFFLHDFDHLQAVLAPQSQVEEDDVGFEFVDPGDGMRSVSGGGDDLDGRPPAGVAGDRVPAVEPAARRGRGISLAFQPGRAQAGLRRGASGTCGRRAIPRARAVHQGR